MSGNVQTIGGIRVYFREPDARPIASERDAADLIGELYGLDAEWIVLPVAQLAPDFFRLKSGLAGTVTQKLVNYRQRAAVVGDVSEHVAASNAFHDFVRESNRGHHIWFVADIAELKSRLGA
jgi:hypothetical protein